MLELMDKDIVIPSYVKLQFVSNHIENELASNKPELLPDALRWRKISYLTNQGYLGRYPGYFLDGSEMHENYLNKILNIGILSQEEEMFDALNSTLSDGSSLHNKYNKRFLERSSKNNSSSSLASHYNNLDDEKTGYLDGGYYIDGNINWNSKLFSDETATTPDLFKVKDLSIPTKFQIPTKTDIKYQISKDELTISTFLIENSMFNLYPRGNHKGGVFTISLDTYITPLLCIYYYEVLVTEGLEDECDVSIGFIKDELRNVTFTATGMIDMRGTDERATGWYGKNGCFTVWNDKRMENMVCKFGRGDTVGFGYNLYKDQFFITKNGILVSETGSVEKFFERSFEGKKNVKGLIPTLSLGSWSGVRIKLGNKEGAERFKFDIENYVKDNKFDYKNKIQKSKIEPFKLPDKSIVKNDSDLTRYIDGLVLSYLKYGGYADTVKAMENDLVTLKKDNFKGIQENRKDKPGSKTLLELCDLKKKVKYCILKDDFTKARKLLEAEYPGFFTTYRKINFRLKIVKLINMLINPKKDISECLKSASRLKSLFREEDCQYYIDRISILFSYNDPKECPHFNEFYHVNKTKIIHAIIMAVNEQNYLPFISSLDLVILRTDQNIESYVDGKQKDKGPLLLNLLEDYIKY